METLEPNTRISMQGRAIEVKTWDNKTHILRAEVAQGLIDAMKTKATSAVLPGGLPLIFSNIKEFNFIDLPDESDMMELPSGLNVDAIEPNSPKQEAWMRLLGVNTKRMAEKDHPFDRVPLLKSLDDLERYEAHGEWPEYLPVSEWPSAKRHRQRPAMCWLKRTVSEGSFMRHYLGHSGYYKLDDFDGKITLAYYRPKPAKLSRHLEFCTQAEIDEIVGRIEKRAA